MTFNLSSILTKLHNSSYFINQPNLKRTGSVHFYFTITSKKPGFLNITPYIDLPPPPPKSSSPKSSAKQQTILVTGGGGLAGTNIITHLLKDKSLASINIIGLDLFLPRGSRNIVDKRVEFIASDLCSASDNSLIDLLVTNNVIGIIHTAGLVWMKDDPASLFNVNTFATSKMLHCARSAKTVKGFIITSSASVINNGKEDRILMSPELVPAGPFESHYAESKANAEISVISSNHENFKTISLRLPGVYGLDDPWLFGPLVKRAMPPLPAVPAKKVEMVYVENVAVAHVEAIKTLIFSSDKIAKKASGRTYNITNCEPDISMGELLDISYDVFPQKSEKPQYLNLTLSYFITIFVEVTYWFCSGSVPKPFDPFWNFTRNSLGYMTHDGTFSTAGNEDIGYKPLFTTRLSVLRIKHLVDEREKAKNK